MTNKEIAKTLIDLVGGKENIISVQSCMTRCRLELKNHSLVKMIQLEKSEAVLGIVQAEGQLQVIYGPGKVTKITAEVKIYIESNPQFGNDATKATKEKLKAKNDTKMKNALKKLGATFIPLIPLFVSCGLVLAINNIAGVYFGDAYKLTNTAKVIGLIGSGVFTVLSVLVGVNAAKEFGSQMPMMGGVLGGILSSAALSNIVLFGNKLTPGRGGIISIILVVLLACFVEKSLKKVIPDVLDLFVTPLVTLTVSVLMALIVLQPIGGFISDSIGTIVAQTLSSQNLLVSILSGTISGALFLPLVMTGMHQALTPIHADLITNVGFTVLLPVLATSGMAQVGASVAVYKKTKNQKLKSIAKNGLFAGILGIGEPLIYGVTLPLGRPFTAACLGAGVGGATMAFFKVGAVAMGVSGLPLALLIADGKMFVFLIGVFVSYFAGYLFTELLGFEDPAE
ncbi:MAG: PTS transporter subunit EIIC [Fusobacteriaceae bacterium]